MLRVDDLWTELPELRSDSIADDTLRNLPGVCNTMGGDTILSEHRSKGTRALDQQSKRPAGSGLKRDALA